MFCALSFADCCPLEYGGFPIIIRNGVFCCCKTLSEFCGNISLKRLSPSLVSPNWKVSVRQIPGNDV